MNNIGQTLKRIRHTRGLNQQEMIELIFPGQHISKQTYSNYENGKNTPDAYLLHDIAKILGVPMETFFDFTYPTKCTKKSQKSLIELYEYMEKHSQFTLGRKETFDWYVEVIERQLTPVIDKIIADPAYSELKYDIRGLISSFICGYAMFYDPHKYSPDEYFEPKLRADLDHISDLYQYEKKVCDAITIDSYSLDEEIRKNAVLKMLNSSINELKLYLGE